VRDWVRRGGESGEREVVVVEGKEWFERGGCGREEVGGEVKIVE
jgi:hypothetical protein